jgi:hypothetical protein
MKMQPAVLLACFLTLVGTVVPGCAGASTGSGTSESTAQSIDALLLGGASGIAPDGGNPCVSCVQSACGSEVTALETELTTLRTEAVATFTCVKDSRCFSLFFVNRDAGRAAAGAAVQACIAGCEADAGLPSREAAASAISGLAGALDMCIDSSCASQCPGAANDHDDQ